MHRNLVWFVLFAAVAPLGAQQHSDKRREASAERVVSNPASVPASQVNFLKDQDMVIGVEQNGAAKAYWLPMAVWVHFIQDRLGDLPILVTW